MYRILLLSDINSSHTQKWAFALAEKGVQVGIFSLSNLHTEGYKNKKNITLFFAKPFNRGIFHKATFFKASYLKTIPDLKKVIRQFMPDIVHAHYASSYGLLGALSGYHPLIISVWGSDIYDFPEQNAFFRAILKYNLSYADKILSTSQVMAAETKKYTAKDIEVTPFGINIDLFKPESGQRELVGLSASNIVLGTIKTLEKKYGIEYLLKAFALAKNKCSGLQLKLLITGKGSLMDELKLLAKEQGIENDTIFTGFIDYKKIPAYHNLFDIEVFPSIMDSESFGVSVLEASSCAKPVIVSDVGGLPEVVENGVTGIVVPPASPGKIAEAMEKLIKDEKLRTDMGGKGRARVEKMYNLEDNVKQMIEIYHQTINRK